MKPMKPSIKRTYYPINTYNAESYFGQKLSETVKQLFTGLKENFNMDLANDTYAFDTSVFGDTCIPAIRNLKSCGLQAYSLGIAHALDFTVEIPFKNVSYPAQVTKWCVHWYLNTDVVSIYVHSDVTSALNANAEYNCASDCEVTVLAKVCAAIEDMMSKLEALYRKAFKIKPAMTRYRDAWLVEVLEAQDLDSIDFRKSAGANIAANTKLDLHGLRSDVILDLLKSVPTSYGRCYLLDKSYTPFLKQIKSAKSVGQFCKLMRKELGEASPDWWHYNV